MKKRLINYLEEGNLGNNVIKYSMEMGHLDPFPQREYPI